MKKNDVPQDNTPGLGGFRKAVYATDDSGNYSITASTGWDAEEIVLEQAVAEFSKQTRDALERAHRNEASPLEFHMFNCRMDPLLLAQSTGFFQWQVKRHLKPKPFSRLTDKHLLRYSEALGIPVEKLSQLPVIEDWEQEESHKLKPK